MSLAATRAARGLGTLDPSAASILLRQPLTTWLLPAASARNEAITTCSQVSPEPSGNGASLRPAALKKFVAVGPGHTASARTPLPRSSSSSARLQCSTKALVAPYVAIHGVG